MKRVLSLLLSLLLVLSLVLSMASCFDNAGGNEPGGENNGGEQSGNTNPGGSTDSGNTNPGGNTDSGNTNPGGDGGKLPGGGNAGNGQPPAAPAAQLDYQVSADGSYYTVTGGKNIAGVLVIPETHEGKPVKEIAARAFSDKWALKEVVLPDSLTAIGESAFSGCYSLARITLGKGLASLDEYCFNACPVVEIYNRSALPLTVGGDGYLQYNAKYIYGEGGESRITRENGYMIYTEGETKLLLGYLGTETKLTLPAGITEIGKYALARERFTEISVPDSVTRLGEGAFSGCSYLTTVTLGAGIAVLPDYTFSGCMSLTSVSLPAGLTKIERMVFDSCSALSEIVLPDSVTEIGMDSFSRCQSLASVHLGSGLGRIGDGVFANCAKLAEITIPASVKTIYEKAFSGCSSLTRVIFEKTEGWTVGGAPLDSTALATPEAAAEAVRTNSGRTWSNKT